MPNALANVIETCISAIYEPTPYHSNFNKKPNEVYAQKSKKSPNILVLLANLTVALTVFIALLQTVHVAFYKTAVVCRPSIL